LAGQEGNSPMKTMPFEASAGVTKPFLAALGIQAT
jgi:hypothetical protein